MITPYWYTRETNPVLFHLKTNKQDESGETILYAAESFFVPVYYNLDARKYEIPKVDFLVDVSRDRHTYYFSEYDSPLLSRVSGPFDEGQFDEKYNLAK